MSSERPTFHMNGENRNDEEKEVEEQPRKRARLVRHANAKSGDQDDHQAAPQQQQRRVKVRLKMAGNVEDRWTSMPVAQQQQQQPQQEEQATALNGQNGEGWEEVSPDRRCEILAQRLREQIGRGQAMEEEEGERVTATRDQQGLGQVCTGSEVKSACGEEAPELKPYQLVGVNFLLLLRNLCGGAIIADEMGLGKTAQCVAFLAVQRWRGETRPALIVAPASLLDTWLDEMSTWAPRLRVRVYYGNRRHEEREELARYQEGGDLEGEERPFDVLLTCYTLYERKSEEQKEDRRFLTRWSFSAMVLDEAHLIKNRNSARARTIRRVADSASFRVMLTGTPLQNDLWELESLLQLLAPEVFDQRGQLFPGADEATREEKQEHARKAKRLLAPFTLRRLKEEVLDQLAPKESQDLRIDLHPRQAELYSSAVTRLKTQLDPKKETQSRLKDAFTHLRRVANHPLLVRSLYTGQDLETISRECHRRALFGSEASLDRVREHVSSLSDFDIHRLCEDPALSGSLLHLRLPNYRAFEAGKADKLRELLEGLRQEGSRVLVFSQWKLMLDVAEFLLSSMELPYTRLDGDTDVAERQARVDAFNDPSSGLFVFLLSTRAGGQGLNLTGADAVILHDPDYTPSVDRQAIDRAHRLGQTKRVRVYRLIARETVDERIIDIAEHKQGLNREILAQSSGGSSEEAASMSEILLELLKS